MSNAIIITRFEEIKNVRIVCEKCGESVIASGIEGAEIDMRECPHCRNFFHPDVIAYAMDLKRFVKQYEKKRVEKKLGAAIWFETDLKVV